MSGSTYASRGAEGGAVAASHVIMGIMQLAVGCLLIALTIRILGRPLRRRSWHIRPSSRPRLLRPSAVCVTCLVFSIIASCLAFPGLVLDAIMASNNLYMFNSATARQPPAARSCFRVTYATNVICALLYASSSCWPSCTRCTPARAPAAACRLPRHAAAGHGQQGKPYVADSFTTLWRLVLLHLVVLASPGDASFLFYLYNESGTVLGPVAVFSRNAEHFICECPAYTRAGSPTTVNVHFVARSHTSSSRQQQPHPPYHPYPSHQPPSTQALCRRLSRAAALLRPGMQEAAAAGPAAASAAQVLSRKFWKRGSALRSRYKLTSAPKLRQRFLVVFLFTWRFFGRTDAPELLLVRSRPWLQSNLSTARTLSSPPTARLVPSWVLRGHVIMGGIQLCIGLLLLLLAVYGFSPPTSPPAPTRSRDSGPPSSSSLRCTGLAGGRGRANTLCCIVSCLVLSILAASGGGHRPCRLLLPRLLLLRSTRTVKTVRCWRSASLKASSRLFIRRRRLKSPAMSQSSDFTSSVRQLPHRLAQSSRDHGCHPDHRGLPGASYSNIYSLLAGDFTASSRRTFSGFWTFPVFIAAGATGLAGGRGRSNTRCCLIGCLMLSSLAAIFGFASYADILWLLAYLLGDRGGHRAGRHRQPRRLLPLPACDSSDGRRGPLAVQLGDSGDGAAYATKTGNS
uniref:G protein-coupled receptor n=1 Tax=Macrostomum lignano TaxID=282301 RepID=A0A1I8FNW0_9PLAT